MKLGITGNRNIVHDVDEVKKEFERLVSSLNPTTVVTGMAVGFDQLVAWECVRLGIPFAAAVPFITQAKLWPKPVQNDYMTLLEKASEVVVVSEGDYAPWKMFKRNEWIVDNTDMMVAYLQTGDGGTYQCVEYAKRKGRNVQYVLKPT